MSLLSSGDLAADRRFLWAEASRKEGDLAGAADLYRQALENAPGWAAAWFGLGEALNGQGLGQEAREAFQTCLSIAPDDPFGASLHLARIDGQRLATMPGEYVARLFDDYADRFDSHLVETLAYRGPQILRGALERVMPQPHRFEVVCDLGCGTGLMARALAERAATIDGVDLSPRMAKSAKATGLYRTVAVGDCASALRAAPGRYDLLVAADVLVYIGDLSELFEAAAKAARPTALFAFTVQAGERDDFSLGPDLRYRHSSGYLRDLASRTGWQVMLLEPAVTRKDGGQDVPGLIAVLSRHRT